MAPSSRRITVTVSLKMGVLARSIRLAHTEPSRVDRSAVRSNRAPAIETFRGTPAPGDSAAPRPPLDATLEANVSISEIENRIQTRRRSNR